MQLLPRSAPGCEILPICRDFTSKGSSFPRLSVKPMNNKLFNLIMLPDHFTSLFEDLNTVLQASHNNNNNNTPLGNKRHLFYAFSGVVLAIVFAALFLLFGVLFIVSAGVSPFSPTFLGVILVSPIVCFFSASGAAILILVSLPHIFILTGRHEIRLSHNLFAALDTYIEKHRDEMRIYGFDLSIGEAVQRGLSVKDPHFSAWLVFRYPPSSAINNATPACDAHEELWPMVRAGMVSDSEQVQNTHSPRPLRLFV